MSGSDLGHFPSAFWGVWVVVLTVAGLLWLAWLLFATYRARATKPADEVWDETLSEGDAAPPRWWFFMLLGFLFFTVAYLVVYPGLGQFRGVLRWTQFSQFEAGRDYYDAKYAAANAHRENAPLADLQADPAQMKSAARIFQNHCAACHGADARGQANRFPNLRDDKWQWGGGEAHIAQSIRDGRRAAMPAWGAIVKEDGARKIARYALALGGGGEGGGEDAQHAEGKALYGQFCVACHGAQGLGNPALGAPNLVDSVWLYGGDEDSIYESIFAGRDGEMPAQAGRLSESQIRVLTAWLLDGAR